MITFETMKNKIILILSILLGLLMAFSGAMKFINNDMPEMPEAAIATMEAFLETGWLMPLVGIVELLGGILLAIPKTRIIGALALLPVTVGIALFNTFQAPDGMFFGFIVLAILLFILGSACDKIKGLLN